MTAFSDDLVDRILERISEGESIRSICRDDDMPSKSTWFKWVANDEKLADQYARAMDERADAVFEDIIDIADGRLTETMPLGDSVEVRTAEDVQRDRLRVDARKWVVARMKPKKYGDRAALDIELGESTREMISTLGQGRERASKRDKPES